MFEIRVKINDQKSDICLTESKPSVEFSEIFPKLKEVVHFGANEEVGPLTHDFEVCLKTFLRL